MAEWEDPDFFSLFGGDSAPWYQESFSEPDYSSYFPDLSGLDFGLDYSFPTFDPGEFDLGFNPVFDLGQYAPQLADPFSIPTGDLSLPDYDLTSLLASEPTFNTGDFNPSLGMFGASNLVPTSFGGVPELSAGLQELVGGPEVSGLSGMNDVSNVFDYPIPDPGQYVSPFSSKLDLGGYAGGAGGGTSSQGELGGSNKGGLDARDRYYDAAASSAKLTPWLGVGQLALGLGGSLAGALSGPPKKHISQFEKDQAAINVQLAREEMAMKERIAAMQAGASGGGGGGADMGDRDQQAREANATAIKVAEIGKRRPLFESDPRFSQLYNETTTGQAGLTPDNPEIQAMTQQIYSTRLQAATEEFNKQRVAVNEQANRLGTNPAQQLSDIDAAEQKAQQALFVEAQTQALAFAQSRLDPSNELLQSILKTIV